MVGVGVVYEAKYSMLGDSNVEWEDQCDSHEGQKRQLGYFVISFFIFYLKVHEIIIDGMIKLSLY